jgi:hypothetical protein
LEGETKDEVPFFSMDVSMALYAPQAKIWEGVTKDEMRIFEKHFSMVRGPN